MKYNSKLSIYKVKKIIKFFCTDIDATKTAILLELNRNTLANDAILRLVHESRLRWLKTAGFSEMDISGCGLITAFKTLIQMD